MTAITKQRNIFLILWGLCVLGAIALIPYVISMVEIPASESWVILGVAMIVQAIVMYGFFCWASAKLLPKTDLKPFPALVKGDVYTAILAGLSVGLFLFVADQYVIGHAGITPPRWAGLIASIYGAINEEVFSRLFLFTLLYFLVGKCVRIQDRNRSAILWCVTVFIALLFGAGHLPAAAAIAPLTGFEVSRILVLNGIGGVVFGWLYWSRGLWAAMIAHFVADIVIHVVLPI